MKLKEVTIKGTKVWITVEQNGRFEAEVDGETYDAKTLDELEAQLTKALTGAGETP